MAFFVVEKKASRHSREAFFLIQHEVLLVDFLSLQLGITKKVSLTLSEEDWAWFEEEAKGNRSQLLRYLIGQEQSPEGRWSNNACLGYAILGAKKLGYGEEQIGKLIRAIYSEFDWKSVDQAKEVYNESPY